MMNMNKYALALRHIALDLQHYIYTVHMQIKTKLSPRTDVATAALDVTLHQGRLGNHLKPIASKRSILSCDTHKPGFFPFFF